MSAGDEGFLSRWSRRKIAARGEPPHEAQPAAPVPESPVAGDGAPALADTAGEAAAALPPLESLTPHSDFAPFMRGGVDPAVKGEALKTLFSDPALYPMDGLDVYIDDYSKPDPLPPGWLEQLQQFAHLHEQPKPAATPAEDPDGAALEAPAESAAIEAAAAPGGTDALPEPAETQAAEGGAVAPSGAPGASESSPGPKYRDAM